MSSLPPPPPPSPAPGGGSNWPSYPAGASGPTPSSPYGSGSVPSGYQAYNGPPTDYASFGQRFVALFIDGLVNLLIMAPLAIPGWILIRNAFEECDTIGDEVVCPAGSPKGGPLAAGIILMAVAYIIAAIIHCRWVGRSQTPGQKAMNIRVLDSRTGQPIGAGRAFGRWLFKGFISGTVCFLGYLWMLWDPNKQTWHDKVANSVVVKV